MDQTESKAVRLSRLIDEIGYSLEKGVILENKLDAAMFLYATTPDQEKDSVRMSFRNMLETIKVIRARKSSEASRNSKLKYFEVKHV